MYFNSDNNDIKNLRNIVQQGWVEKYPNFANTYQRWFPLDANYLSDKTHYSKLYENNKNKIYPFYILNKNIPELDESYDLKIKNGKQPFLLNKNLELSVCSNYTTGNIICPITMKKTECFVKISPFSLLDNDDDDNNDSDNDNFIYMYNSHILKISNKNNKKKYIWKQEFLEIILNYELKNNDFIGHFYIRHDYCLYVILITKNIRWTINDLMHVCGNNLNAHINNLNPYIMNNNKRKNINNILKLNDYKVNNKINKILSNTKNKYDKLFTKNEYKISFLNSLNTISLLRALFAQIIFFALGNLKFNHKFIHNDFKSDNIMLDKTNEKYVYVRIYDNNQKIIRIMQIPTFGYLVKLIDFGWSSYEIKTEDITYDLYSSRQILYGIKNDYVDVAQLSIIFLRYFNNLNPIFAENFWLIDNNNNNNNDFLELQNFISLLLEFACNDDKIIYNNMNELDWDIYFYTYVSKYCKRKNSIKDLYEYFEDYMYNKPLDKKMIIGNYLKGCFIFKQNKDF